MADTMEAVESMDIDLDPVLMPEDFDDEDPTTDTLSSTSKPTTDTKADTTTPVPENETRKDTLYATGTDDMSTEQVMEYFTSQHHDPIHIEWIDDAHCNVCFATEEAAKKALAELQKLQVEPKQRLLTLRYATLSDVKQKGAAARSRYYLLHGEGGKSRESEERQSRRRRAGPYDRRSRHSRHHRSNERLDGVSADFETRWTEAADGASRPRGTVYSRLGKRVEAEADLDALPIPERLRGRLGKKVT
ncbi:hypothetical protein BZG36_00374 [Bifiguratus adelaidae]|uniref:RRM domain-containing protein n=1 Tax=Bifiguratus adelaidae TaxID=1938954 RepID=A0A261Y7M8_9FUNG|nr:hypothetical protein BZG36_00374 [Bifiguratus adelaidae]